MLSLIIPTLNAAGGLTDTLSTVTQADEVVVVDGGSTDGTPALARAWGARVVTAPKGRGSQLARGATMAQGSWFLFLHGDTRLEQGWADHVATFIADPENQDRAAVFTYALDDDHPAARQLERIVAWRIRHFALPYGDQGLLISRAFYDRLGGYRPLPLMEDVDIIRRIGGHRLRVLGARAHTSAIRYRREGYLRRTSRNLACLGLYMMGVPPHWILRLYG